MSAMWVILAYPKPIWTYEFIAQRTHLPTHIAYAHNHTWSPFFGCLPAVQVLYFFNVGFVLAHNNSLMTKMTRLNKCTFIKFCTCKFLLSEMCNHIIYPSSQSANHYIRRIRDAQALPVFQLPPDPPVGSPTIPRPAVRYDHSSESRDEPVSPPRWSSSVKHSTNASRRNHRTTSAGASQCEGTACLLWAHPVYICSFSWDCLLSCPNKAITSNRAVQVV